MNKQDGGPVQHTCTPVWLQCAYLLAGTLLWLHRLGSDHAQAAKDKVKDAAEDSGRAFQYAGRSGAQCTAATARDAADSARESADSAGRFVGQSHKLSKHWMLLSVLKFSTGPSADTSVMTAVSVPLGGQFQQCDVELI